MLQSAEQLEAHVNLRCKGCGDRIVDGFNWYLISVINHPEQGLVRAVGQVTTCSDSDCPAFKELEASEDTVARTRFEVEWLDAEEPEP